MFRVKSSEIHQKNVLLFPYKVIRSCFFHQWHGNGIEFFFFCDSPLQEEEEPEEPEEPDPERLEKAPLNGLRGKKDWG